MTLTEAQTHLDAWYGANLALATGKSYSIGGRQLTRADAAEIRTEIKFWERRVQELTSGASGGTKKAALVTWG